MGAGRVLHESQIHCSRGVAGVGYAWSSIRIMTSLACVEKHSFQLDDACDDNFARSPRPRQRQLPDERGTLGQLDEVAVGVAEHGEAHGVAQRAWRLGFFRAARQSRSVLACAVADLHSQVTPARALQCRRTGDIRLARHQDQRVSADIGACPGGIELHDMAPESVVRVAVANPQFDRDA